MINNRFPKMKQKGITLKKQIQAISKYFTSSELQFIIPGAISQDF